MGLLRTNAGDDLLKSNIRWDNKKKGYWVTLYPDGEPKEYFVNKVYGEGAKERQGEMFLGWHWQKPGLGALYETAIAQEIGYDELNNGEDPGKMMRLITGKEPDMRWIGGSGDEMPKESLDQARSGLKNGSAVIAGSVHSFPDSNSQTISVDACQVQDGKVVKTEVEVYSSHAYSVARIDQDGGIWLQNPHGHNNAADGGESFKISKDDYKKYFPYLEVSGAP